MSPTLFSPRSVVTSSKIQAKKVVCVPVVAPRALKTSVRCVLRISRVYLSKKNITTCVGRVSLPIVRCSLAREEAKADQYDEKPGMILRVSRGTTFLGLLSARKQARAQVQGDEEQTKKVEWAFRRLVSAGEDKFKQAIEEGPEDVTAVYNYANFLQTIEDFDASEIMYRKVLDLDAANVDALNNLAMLLHEQKGDFEGADTLYSSLIEQNPQDIDALFNWALLKKDGFKDLKAANGLMDKIVKINPGMADHDLVLEFRKSAAMQS